MIICIISPQIVLNYTTHDYGVLDSLHHLTNQNSTSNCGILIRLSGGFQEVICSDFDGHI